MRRAEDTLQASIINYLRLVCPDLIIAAIPNGGKRGPAEAAMLKRTGMLKGLPDIVIVGYLGQSYWIEVKTAKGRLSPAQSAIALQMTTMGVPSAVCRSIDDVRVALAAWKIETREVRK